MACGLFSGCAKPSPESVAQYADILSYRRIGTKFLEIKMQQFGILIKENALKMFCETLAILFWEASILTHLNQMTEFFVT